MKPVKKLILWINTIDMFFLFNVSVNSYKRREKRKKSVDFKDRNRVISISNQARRTSKRRAESKRKKI